MSNHANAPIVDFCATPVRGAIKVLVEPRVEVTHGGVIIPDDEDTDAYIPRTGIIMQLGQPMMQMGTEFEVPWDVKVGDRVLLTMAALAMPALREDPDGLPIIMIPFGLVHGIIRA